MTDRLRLSCTDVDDLSALYVLDALGAAEAVAGGHSDEHGRDGDEQEAGPEVTRGSDAHGCQSAWILACSTIRRAKASSLLMRDAISAGVLGSTLL